MKKSLIDDHGWTARKHWYAKEDKFQWVMSHDPYVEAGQCLAYEIHPGRRTWTRVHAWQISSCGAIIDSYPPGYEPSVTSAGKLWEHARIFIDNTDENLESQMEWMRDQYDREHHDQLDTPRPRVCDCGGEKAGTTHSTWCSTQGGDK